MTWKLVLQIIDALENNLQLADQLMQQLPPGEALHQECLSDIELKQQILSHAPNVDNCLRSLRELFLRKDKQMKDILCQVQDPVKK